MTQPILYLPVTLLLALALICIPSAASAQTQPADAPATRPADDASHDHFIGWYRLPRRAQGSLEVIEKGPPRAFIPILKRNGTYYSVCRFFEMPMKAIPGGLEWDLKPSSMVGTKITYDPQTKQYTFKVNDSAAQGHDGEVSGLLEPVEKVDAPLTVLDPTTTAPAKNDDFVGWYQAVWEPAIRYHITRQGDKFMAEGQIVGMDDRNRPAFEIQPLTDALGFKMDSRGESQLIYNTQRQRYEISSPKAGISMPLKRTDAEPSKDLPKLRDQVPVGIPSWN